MQERLKMRPGLPAYDWWVTPPPVLTSLYIFNVTNSHQFLSGEDDMLQLQEIGPVVYLELLIHKNVTFHPNGTLTYVGHRELAFQPNLTKVDINASLVVPNLSVLGIASYLHDASFFTKIGLSVLLRRLRSEPFSHVTVYDYLWNYKDPLLQVARNLAPFLVPVNNIGVLQTMYREKDDEVTVHIGPGSDRRFFTMDRYHGRPRFGYWPDERCDTVEGATEGVLYQQDIRRNDSLRYFRKALCRVAPITYAGDVLRDGVDAYRFELPDNFFDRFEDPSTDCFAGDPSAPLVSGLSDCSPCFFNFPLAASAPHFMNGDPVLIDSVRGMNPQRDKHGSYIVVEPITGIPMESCARIQSNLVVRKLSGISKKLERFSNISIPMFWAEYHQKDLPWYIYYFLYFVVNILPDLQSWISFIMVTSGIGMLIAGLTSAMCAPEKRKNNSYKFLDLTTSSSCSSSSSS
ncbi:hypothetical protein R5R35_014364 [Gryllus longicercus]